ncbi:MAG: hypothetical protein NUV54_02325 [Candidatus Taylorbacteria bacterium]|nr:hypothetical protein [Candidatus Taylorbacteria bacterium]
MKKKMLLVSLLLCRTQVSGQEGQLQIQSVTPASPDVLTPQETVTFGSYFEKKMVFYGTNDLFLRMGRDYFLQEHLYHLPPDAAVHSLKDLFRQGSRSAFFEWAESDTELVSVRDSLRDLVLDVVRPSEYNQGLSQALPNPSSWKDGLRLGLRPASLDNPYVYIHYGWLDSDESPLLNLDFKIRAYEWQEPRFELFTQIPISKKWQLGIGAEVRPFQRRSSSTSTDFNDSWNHSDGHFAVTFGLDGPFFDGRIYIRLDPVQQGGVLLCSLPLW